MQIRALVLLFLAGLSAFTAAHAQTITGTISGTVLDPSGLAVVGADVTLTNARTGLVRKTTTNQSGDFFFSAVEPGAYDLSVEASGFKKLQKTAINLTANERLSTGPLALEVGSLTQTVTVQAEGAVVQTASAERSGVLTSSQIQDLMVKGRNVHSLLQLLPGVVDTASPDGPDRNFAIGLWVNGERRNAIGMWLDGVPTQDSGVGWINTLNVSMDAVAEVKVLLNQYQAEYGRSRGAGVQIVSKSGTREFHGSVGYYKRHEQFNANSFFNNRTIVGGKPIPKPRYRYNTFIYSIGGPIFIPEEFNKERNKLFFHWTQEFWPQRSGVGPTNITVPTELEREGNFSQSINQAGNLILVKDPSTGQNFPGNIIPKSHPMWDSNGQALLKIFPLPNFFDRSISGGAYNYVSQVEVDRPQILNTLKIDFNATSNDILAVTWSRQEDKQTGTMGLATPNANWPFEYRTFLTRGNIVSARYQKILSPTLVNELTLGYNWRWENETIPEEQFNKLKRSTVGYNAPQLHPAANPLGLLPNVTFGGASAPNAGNIRLTNIPYEVRYPTVVLTNNITKTYRSHVLKAGIFLNRASTTGAASTDRGSVSFASTTNNPLETNHTYANAILGVFNSVSQANRSPGGGTIHKAYEWFVQDSWKANRRLTLELGLRFVAAPPSYGTTLESAFSLSRWKESDKVALIQPTRVDGQRRGIDPKTGIIYPVVAIGAIAPSGGNFANGMFLSTDPGVPRGMQKGPGLLYSPRFGFAYDVFGNAKTAIRGGFGIFQSAGATGEARVGSAYRIPIVITSTVYFGTLSSLGAGSGGFIFPSSARDNQDPKGVARSYAANFGIQQDIGWGTVVDISYVGTFGRHLRWTFDYDPIPIGARFNPANLDPTTGSALPDNFLRRYTGYSGVTHANYGATSNYHSLQTMVNRRFTRGLQFGTSYTWSKWMNAVDYDDNSVSPFVPARRWNYGLSQMDRLHNLRINFLYELPNSPWRNPASRWVLNGWQVSGITAFISGGPANVGFSTTNNKDITGTPSSGARVVVTGKVELPKSERTFYRYFRTDVFKLPDVGTLGNGGKWLLRGPGINNWDLSIIKNFPIREPLRLQYRLEMYNAFNHTQYSGLNTTAPFDANGNLLTTTTFGQVTSTRTPRQMQMALRFNF